MIYVQLCSTYAPSWAFGGVVRILYGYATYMAKSCETWVFAGNLDERQRTVARAFDDEQPYHIRRYGLLSRRLARRNVHTLSPRMLVDVLILIWRSPEPVILHISEFRGLPNLYALIAKLIFKRKVRIVHSAFGGLHEKTSRLRRYYDRLLTGPFLRALDLALPQNENEKAEYRRLMEAYGAVKCPENIVMMPLQLDETNRPAHWFENSLKAKSVKADMRKRLGLGRHDQIMCFLGRFHAEKGILRIIDLFTEYTYSCGDVPTKLLIIGRDEGFESEVRSYANGSKYADRIRIVTDVYVERYDYYFVSDLFLGMPTIFEETMLSSLEAISCGTPALLSSEGCAPYVQKAGAGFVFDYDQKTGAGLMKKIFDHHDEFSRNARDVSSKFCPSVVMPRFYDQLLQLASGVK